MELISMTDFVLFQHAETSNQNEFEDKCYNYATFINQKPEKWMFVPCDEEGEPIIERHYQYFDNEIEHSEYLRNFEKAKQKVFFAGWKVLEKNEDFITIFDENNNTIEFNKNGRVWVYDDEVKTIEDLIPYKLTLILKIIYMFIN